MASGNPISLLSGTQPPPQEDSARPHRARVNTDYFHDVGVERNGVASNGPDLNPTEHFGISSDTLYVLE